MLPIVIALGLIAIVAVVKLVVIPANLIAGVDGVVETLSDTAVISEGNTSGEIAFTFEGGYSAVPKVSIGAGISAKSGGSSSISVTVAEIKTGTKLVTGVTITVTLDAAPGAGETTTVEVDLTIMGPGTK